MNDKFNKYLNPFVKLCHTYGHKPSSLAACCWCRLYGMMVVRMLGWQTLELETHSKGSQFCDTLDPGQRIRFSWMGVMIESQRAMQLTYLLMLDMQPSCRMLRGINLIYTLQVRSLSIFQVLSTLIHISRTGFATRWRLVDMSNPDVPTMNELDAMYCPRHY